jgi:hypothetical protein
MYCAKRKGFATQRSVPGFFDSGVGPNPSRGLELEDICWQNWKIREANSGKSLLPSRIDAVN